MLTMQTPNQLTAWARALHSLMRLDLLWHLVWPTVLAFLLWGGLLVATWTEVVVLLVGLLRDVPLVGAWFADGNFITLAVTFGIHFLLILLLFPLALLTANVLIAVLSLPLMLERVAKTDYPEVQARRGGTQIGSVTNAVVALLLFVVLVVVTLPVWLIPGANVFLSVALVGWLNQRCYRYDALMQHADAYEMTQLPKQHRVPFYLLGFGGAALGHIPFLNFFVPALTGLAYIHYCLEILRVARRSEHIIDVELRA